MFLFCLSRIINSVEMMSGKVNGVQLGSPYQQIKSQNLVVVVPNSQDILEDSWECATHDASRPLTQTPLICGEHVTKKVIFSYSC